MKNAAPQELHIQPWTPDWFHFSPSWTAEPVFVTLCPTCIKSQRPQQRKQLTDKAAGAWWRRAFSVDPDYSSIKSPSHFRAAAKPVSRHRRRLSALHTKLKRGGAFTPRRVVRRRRQVWSQSMLKIVKRKEKKEKIAHGNNGGFFLFIQQINLTGIWVLLQSRLRM